MPDFEWKSRLILVDSGSRRAVCGEFLDEGVTGGYDVGLGCFLL